MKFALNRPRLPPPSIRRCLIGAGSLICAVSLSVLLGGRLRNAAAAAAGCPSVRRRRRSSIISRSLQLRQLEPLQRRQVKPRLLGAYGSLRGEQRQSARVSKSAAA